MNDLGAPGDSENLNQPSSITLFFKSISNRYQHYLDRATPYLVARWVAAGALLLAYIIRVYILQGWHIITYAMGIYELNLFIAFLTPKIDPAMSDDYEDGPSLPTKASEEFRPFMRRLPEFKFWHSTFKALAIAFFCTFFQALNVPVFWPILVMYFCILFALTMKRQIKHMIKYRYLPFTHGKTKYRGKDETEKVVQS